jgi:hypothetical protein
MSSTLRPCFAHHSAMQPSTTSRNGQSVQLCVSLVDQQDPLIPKVEVHERSLEAVRLILPHEHGVFVVPMHLDWRIVIVHARRRPADPSFWKGSRRRHAGHEIDWARCLRWVGADAGVASASGAIAAATAGSTTDTTGSERNVLRLSDFKSTGDFNFMRTHPLSYCKLTQYGTGPAAGWGHPDRPSHPGSRD